MTKRKFYIIKTLVAIGLAIFFYFFLDFAKKNTIHPSKSNFAFVCLLALGIGIILIKGADFLFLYKRPKRPIEIEEEQKQIQIEKEEAKEKERKRIEALPVLEITLSTNEKIVGKFEEKSYYFLNMKDNSKIYTRYIVKVEKVKENEDN